MTERLTLSTKTSIFKPIEVVIDGKLYRTERIPPSLIKKILKFEKKAGDGDIDAVMAQLNLVLGVPIEILEEIDIRDLEKTLETISGRIFNPKKFIPADEKDPLKPGPKE